MRKNLFLGALFFLTALSLCAQVPQRFTYQAVVRDASGRLVTNANVGVRISVLEGSENGQVVYTQNEVAHTNAQGLFSIVIGSNGIESIDWGTGTVFFRSEVDPDGGNNYSLSTVQQILSVPYALRAHTVDSIIGGVNYTETDPVFSEWDKDYNDLINRPVIPTNISEFTNDAGYLTSFTESQILSISNDTVFLTGGSFVKLPTAFSGDYNDLTNKPVIPTVPTNVSDFTNDAGYLTSFTETQILSISNDTVFLTGGSFVKLPANFSGDYNVLTNKPAIPTIPSNLSDFTNDAGYLTSFTETQILSISNDTVFLTGGSFVKLPTAFSGDYNDLTNKPVIPTVPTNVSDFTNDAGYLTSFTETQILSISNDTVFLTGGSFVKLPTAFSGDYNDLTNKPVIPTIPTNVSDFTNDAGYLTSFTETQILSISNDTVFLTGGSFVKLPTAFSGDYNDLTNKPVIPTVPTNVSDFTNDAGYLTSFTETQILSISNDTVFLTGGSFVKLPTSFSGDYNDLTNKPVIPTVPTNVSDFTNDAGYITSFTEAQILSISNDTIFLTGGSFVKLPSGFSGDYNDLTNKPFIPTVPTNVSDFTNDAGYLTSFTESQILSISNDTVFLTGGSFVKLPTSFSGDYNDLTNKPVIPTVPTNVSDFTNDAGYLTSFTETQILSISNDTVFLTGGSFVKLPSGFSGDYNDLTNKPAIPTIPSNVSDFTNDAGYLSSFSETQILSISNDTVFLTGGSFVKLPANFSGDYNDLTNKPVIPTVPTNVSDFTNDAGYITSFTETQSLADVAAVNDSINSQIKNLSNPTDLMDAVNLQTLNQALNYFTQKMDSIINRYDSIVIYQQHVIDTLSRITNHASDPFDSIGASYAVFSVSPTKKVRFSKGNLQYTRVGSHSTQGGGTATGTWRFAPNQWDFIGSNNHFAYDSTYTGYLDLFYAGTSGWNNHHPYSSTAYGGNYSGSNVNSDWGVYNAISNGGNAPGMWRTLTYEEWYYLLYTRDMLFNYRWRYVVIENTYRGIIIFPDNYIHPTSLSPIGTEFLVLSMARFIEMEKAGCVFLPTTGYRINMVVRYYKDNSTGSQYTTNTDWRAFYSTATNNKTYPELYIGPSSGSSSGSVWEQDTDHYSYGNPVRLVKDCE